MGSLSRPAARGMNPERARLLGQPGGSRPPVEESTPSFVPTGANASLGPQQHDALKSKYQQAKEERKELLKRLAEARDEIELDLAALDEEEYKSQGLEAVLRIHDKMLKNVTKKVRKNDRKLAKYFEHTVLEPDTDKHQDRPFHEFLQINDSNNKIVATSGAFRTQVGSETSSMVAYGGRYYPDVSLVGENDEPPLFLRISAKDEDSLNEAVTLIKDLLSKPQKTLRNIVGKKRKAHIKQLVEKAKRRVKLKRYYFAIKKVQAIRDERQKFQETASPQEYQQYLMDKIKREDENGVKINIGEMPIVPNINLPKRLLGKNYVNIRYISKQCHCKIRLKGEGSGYIDRLKDAPDVGPLYFHAIKRDDNGDLEAAQSLINELVKDTRDELTFVADRRRERLENPDAFPVRKRARRRNRENEDTATDQRDVGSNEAIQTVDGNPDDGPIEMAQSEEIHVKTEPMSEPYLSKSVKSEKV